MFLGTLFFCNKAIRAPSPTLLALTHCVALIQTRVCDDRKFFFIAMLPIPRVNLVFKADAGWEYINCVGLKPAKTLALARIGNSLRPRYCMWDCIQALLTLACWHLASTMRTTAALFLTCLRAELSANYHQTLSQQCHSHLSGNLIKVYSVIRMQRWPLTATFWSCNPRGPSWKGFYRQSEAFSEISR